MKLKKIVFLSIFIATSNVLLGQTKQIIIATDISKFQDTASLIKARNRNSLKIARVEDLHVSRIYDETIDPNVDTGKFNNYKATANTESYTWRFETGKFVTISNALFPDPFYLSTPGDSICITYDDNNYYFSGRGALKYHVIHEITKAKNSIANPIGYYGGRWLSVWEYLQLNDYFDTLLDKTISIIDTYKSKLNKHDYDWIKAAHISMIEEERLYAFEFIPFKEEHIKQSKLTHTPEDVMTLWDTTMLKTWGKWFRAQNFQGTSFGYIEDFTTYEYFRMNGFRYNNDSVRNSAIFRKYIYNRIRNNPDYKGLFRERALINFLDEEITQELGAWNWFAQSILKDYYSQPGFLAYKQWIKSLEQERQYLLEEYSIAPLFELIDKKGNNFSSSAIKGKFAIFIFWHSDCAECEEAINEIIKLQEEFNDDPNIIFIYVGADKDKKKWLKNINSEKYMNKGGVHLYIDGLGEKNPMLKDFNVTQFPTLRFIDRNGKLVIDKQNPYAHISSGQSLVDLINKQLFRFKDGPYVFYGNGIDTTYSIWGSYINKKSNTKQIVSATDQHNLKLNINLQNQISIPPSTYEEPKQMLVLSDIEGNFTAFRKLLQANGVIDKEFNWIFSDGHLVFAGDMFDRGEQVTECLWLIYSLEEKAQKAGGFVHFILGNHEIMNLNGDDHYLAQKYKNNYALLGRTVKEIYGDRSELGRWLRSKNIIEKIGNKLFCHGGVSPHVNNMSLTIEQINSLARPYYDRLTTALKATDPNLNILFNGRKSPFWYRQYYAANYFSKSNNELIYHATKEQLDNTCQKFGVDHIITGHTIVADTISIHHRGKVINTDTRHADGKSEALLIIGGAYYRATYNGDKILLFKEESNY